MNKQSLKELSVVFSIKIDSNDRLRNLTLNLEYFNTFFTDYEIVIVEQDEKSKIFDVLKGKDHIIHFFIPSKSCHYKTRNLNLATNLTNREIVMMLDADVICHPASLTAAIEIIKKSDAFVAPYNGIATEIRKEHISNCSDIRDIVNKLEFFPKDFNLRANEYDYSIMHPLYGESSYINSGGCLIYKKRTFNAIGGWNTNFISYGFEDMEFVYRIEKLGYTIHRFDNYNIYHLEHYRNSDSYYNNFYNNNRQEWNHVISMTSNELLEYALNGFRKIVFNNHLETVCKNTETVYSIKLIKPKKISLLSLGVIIPLSIKENSELVSLNILLYYLELYFINYEIIVIESKFRFGRYTGFKKNAKYIWMGTKEYSTEEMTKRGLEETYRNNIAIWDFHTLINPVILIEKVRTLAKGQTIKLKDSNWYFKNVEKAKRGKGVMLLRR